MKKTVSRTIKTVVWAAISLILVFALIVANVVAAKWDAPLTGFFGSVGAGGTGAGATFVATDTTREDIDATAQAVSEQIILEGTVLLKNNGALPLSEGNKVSVFGVSSSFWMTGEKITGVTNSAFTQALEKAGLEINTTLRSFYKSSTHKKYGTGSSMGNGSSFSDWNVDEVPYEEYTDAVKESYADFNDAAFVVFSRGGSEGGDVPMWMDTQGGSYDRSYMSLSEEEETLLKNVTANFEKVIVIVHSSNAMDMDFLNKYDVDSVIWIPGTGDAPLTELGELIVGKADFSGRSVDTFVYNNMDSNPSVKNFGDFRYTLADGSLSGYSYVNYAEGIYVGYKYYETRYEDTVLGTANVGEYHYDTTVAFPFGYGLSYNTYTWSNLRVSEPDENGEITVLVDVTNQGVLPGKDVVEVYYQAPYTKYDQDNGIEKASVNLIGFAKTDIIPAGGTQKDVAVTFRVNDMASWDSTYAHDGVSGAYLLDEGKYYVTVATDAHNAVQNILTAKGEKVDGNSELVSVALELSAKEYITVADTGAVYQNNFSDAALSDAVYLSRSNWTVADGDTLIYQDGSMEGVSEVMAADGKVYTHTVSDELLTALQSSGWASSGNPNDPTDTSVYGAITYSADNGLTLANMSGLSYDDEQWELLLDQLSLDDLSALFAQGGYGTVAIESVDKPATKEYDGPARILNLFNGETSYVFPAECMMAATWNVELLEAVGENIGDECLFEGVAGWYAPAMNIHRTAFSGRNFEYYSEDGVLSGILAAAETRAVQSKGVYVYIKHFALNDQETNRGANGRYATFATEQTIREIYLKPFRIAVEDGDAHGIMASMNRVGYRPAIASYRLMTSTLRGEWGFEGIVITDYISDLASEEAEAGVAAGLDLQLITYSNPLSEENLALPGVQHQLRETAHHILFAQANSLAMNGYDFGTPVYQLLLIAVAVLLAIYIVWSGYLVIKYSYFVPVEEGEKVKLNKTDKLLAIVMGAVLAVLLALVAVWFFTTALPALKQAFTL